MKRFLLILLITTLGIYAQQETPCLLIENSVGLRLYQYRPELAEQLNNPRFTIKWDNTLTKIGASLNDTILVHDLGFRTQLLTQHDGLRDGNGRPLYDTNHTVITDYAQIPHANILIPEEALRFEKYHRSERTGTVLMVFGASVYVVSTGALLASGFTVLFRALSLDPDLRKADRLLRFSGISALISLPFLSVGIPLKVSSKKKQKRILAEHNSRLIKTRYGLECPRAE